VSEQDSLSSNEEFNKFKSFIVSIADTCERFSKKLRKSLVVSLLACLVIMAIIIDLSGGIGIIFYILAPIAALPSLLLYFANSRLHAVAELPAKINELHDCVDELNQKLKEKNFSKELGEFLGKSSLSPYQNLKRLIQSAPSLWKMKGAIEEVVKFDIVLTVLSVTNPAFVWFVGFSYAIVILWCIIAASLSLLWVVFG